VAASIMYFRFIPAIVVIFVAALFIGYSLVINKFREESQVEANLREDVEKGTISDIFMNIDSIKYFGKEYRIKGRYHKLSKKTRDGWIKTWDYFRLLDAGHAFVLALGMFFIVYFPVMSFLNGEMTLGTLVFIEGTYVLFIGPLFGFVYGIRGFYQSMADMESIFYYSKLENDVKDSTHAKDLKIRRGEIEFRNVSFKYKRKWIFKNFNLKIPADKKFALVGPSGSGKSTLLKLLYRLYDIQKGEILIDGKNIKDFKQESLRSELSIVPQECVLFDDTIYNNIRFSRPGADRKEVFKAIKFAQLDKIIKNFEKKEKTIVGERGVKLSGGEKQRVSIARALLANKHVLVLDEATSALDSETEHEIQKDLEHLMKGRTSIIIAHRLSTIMKADSIVVLDKGKIVQQAKHGQLIRKPGLYKRLWNLQKGGYLK